MISTIFMTVPQSQSRVTIQQAVAATFSANNTNKIGASLSNSIVV